MPVDVQVTLCDSLIAQRRIQRIADPIWPVVIMAGMMMAMPLVVTIVVMVVAGVTVTLVIVPPTRFTHLPPGAKGDPESEADQRDPRQLIDNDAETLRRRSADDPHNNAEHQGRDHVPCARLYRGLSGLAPGPAAPPRQDRNRSPIPTPNDVIGTLHPKAMPVILKTGDERATWADCGAVERREEAVANASGRGSSKSSTAPR